MDAMELYNAIQKTVADMLASYQLTDFAMGRVLTADPLKGKYEVKLEDSGGMVIDEKNLVLTTNVTDLQVLVESFCESPLCPSPIPGVVMNSIKAGDRLVLIKSSRGQRYIIIGKAVAF